MSDDHTKLWFGLTPEWLFAWTPLVIPAWLLLLFRPRWRWTETVVLSTVTANAITYVFIIGTVIITHGFDSQAFASLDNLARAFSNRTVLYAGWVHYLCFDLLVGRQITHDAVQRGVSIIYHIGVVGPCLLMTFMLGPIGFLCYEIVKYAGLMPPVVRHGKQQ